MNDAMSEWSDLQLSLLIILLSLSHFYLIMSI